MKKVLTGALVFAVAAVVSVAGSMDASAADLEAGKVTVNSSTQTLTVAKGSAKEVGFAVGTVSSKGIFKSAADSAWEWHDVGDAGVVIDLSTLSNTKDNYVELKTDTGENMVIKIPKINSKVKAVYDAVTNTVTMLDTTSNSKGDALAEGTVVEYKNKYGEWIDYSADKLNSYVYKGASLTFRIKAETGAIVKNEDTKAVISTQENSKATPVEKEYYVAKAFPGKEIKVSVKKLANGPKITTNYPKNQITVPKGAEYRLAVTDTWTQLSDINKSENLIVGTDKDGKTTITNAAGTSTMIGGNVGTIEVRTKEVASTDKKVGKPASKISRLSFNKIEPLVTGTTEKLDDNNAVLKLNGDVANAYLGTSADSSPIKVTYVRKTSNKGVTTTTGIEITNSSADAYQIYVDKDDVYKDGAVPAVDVKGVVSVGAATFNNDEAKTLKTAKKVTVAKTKCENAKIYITKVGNAKTPVWASGFVGLGTVKLPADVTPAPADTSAAN